jgi:predicted amidohydrolase
VAAPNDPPTRLTIATCQFSVSGQPAQNAERICGLLRDAAEAGADVAHFSECALSGYATASFESWEGYDWDALSTATDRVRMACKKFGLWAVVGSSYRLPAPHKPHNSVLIIDPVGTQVDRYDKRCCSVRDLNSYTPGDNAHAVTFEINGVRCGVLICLEWSFPSWFRAYADTGCDLVFLSAHAADLKEDHLHGEVVPPLMQGHAFTNNLFLSTSNASNPVQAFPSHWVRRSGRRGETCAKGAPGMVVSTILDEPEKDRLYAKIRHFRRDAENGRFYTAYRAGVTEPVG